MSITDAELEKYKVYIEEGTMEAAAIKLGVTTGAVSVAVRNIDRKIATAIEDLITGIELELPFKRLKKTELMKKFALVLDESKEIIEIPKERVVELKAQGISRVDDFAINAFEEKFEEFMRGAPEKELT
jgi:hypothetical protein